MGIKFGQRNILKKTMKINSARFIIAGGVAVVGILSAIGIATATSNAKKIAATPSSAVESQPETKAVAEVVALSPADSIFPRLNMEVPAMEPVPEVLREGDSHPIVAEIQERLMSLDYMENDEPTQYYGPATMRAVIAFQRQHKLSHNLSRDGILGEDTIDAIFDESAKSYAAQEGDDGDDIAFIQSRLYQLGYLATQDQVSRFFGEKTKQAVISFQERNDLKAKDGKVGHDTLNAMYSEDVKANLLSVGDKSELVLAAQKKLFDLGYLTSVPDGTFGYDTSLAVKRFQTVNGIDIDGYLGPNTRDVLLFGNPQPNGLGLGDSDEQVTKVQKLLAKWGYLPSSSVTGYYGEATENAVKAFQSRNSLGSVDGKVGPITIAKLTSDNVKRPAPVSRPSTNNNRGNNNSSNSSNSSNKNNSSSSGNNAPVYTGGGAVGTLLSVASSKIGSPYVWGSKGPNSFDCSGFVYWCLNNSGVKQSYMTSSGWRSAGRYSRVGSFSDLRAGDIVVVRGHVGIVAGGGEVIDASSSNGRVVRRSLGGWWQRNFIVGWRIF